MTAAAASSRPASASATAPPTCIGLALPALVLHGERDKVIVPSGGRATAAAIPGAELLEVPRMGHDLARWVWPTVIDGIARTAARTESRDQGTDVAS